MIPSRGPAIPASAVDRFLVVLYLAGIYLGIEAHLPGGVPLPGVIAGAAGLALLAKHAGRIPLAEATCIVAIFAVALISIVAAPDVGLLQERFKGLIQFVYSVAIGYSLCLAGRSISAAWLARICLVFCFAILLAGMLENAVPAFRDLSDSFRASVFDSGVYAADRRDLLLYGQVRPKVFTSEPSFVTFGLTFFAFAWYVLSDMRGKALGFVGLLALGYVVLRGPTIMLGILLIPAYQTLLATRTGGPARRRTDWPRALLALMLAGAIAIIGLYAGSLLFTERLAEIASGRDASVFARLIAPPLVAAKVLVAHPIGGVGLAGWEYIEQTVQQVYETSHWLSIDVRFENAAHSLTNWFWLHWIFLGVLFGSAMIFAISVLLRTMGVPSLLFCWIVWSVFGQSAGSYVGPRTWAVLFLAAVVSLLHERAMTARHALAPTPERPPARFVQSSFPALARPR